MVNEIKGLHNAAIKSLPVGQQQHTGQQGNAEGAGENRSTSSQPASDVRITDTAARLRQLEAKIASQPVVDGQRVASIKQALADGTYKINASRTAEKMVEFETLLASKTRDL